jgi:hypothetical protein
MDENLLKNIRYGLNEIDKSTVEVDTREKVRWLLRLIDEAYPGLQPDDQRKADAIHNFEVLWGYAANDFNPIRRAAVYASVSADEMERTTRGLRDFSHRTWQQDYAGLAFKTWMKRWEETR